MAPTTAAGSARGRHSDRARRAFASRKRQHGFGMLWALMCVALIGIYLMQIGTVWSTQIQRNREFELLKKGDAIRNAIREYVKADPGGAFPKSLDDLLRDSRASFVRRYLRDAYTDPMTNGEWQTVRGPNGELYGVYSSSKQTPLKTDGFSDEDASFALKTSYEDWKFTSYPEMSMNRR
ncbi:type II secretion system protein [Caballeronia sp. LP006]|uniref:type II secretion system protein n=1 Tax=unclassified Caballeronia TaxID=2646786 RepID=UPI0020282112|nr:MULTISPECIES: type II secretion system protein [unclassified Caballeronia]MDR5830557.1 type II secretion system protein [Caballeronia sp. LP006]